MLHPQGAARRRRIRIVIHTWGESGGRGVASDPVPSWRLATYETRVSRVLEDRRCQSRRLTPSQILSLSLSPVRDKVR